MTEDATKTAELILAGRFDEHLNLLFQSILERLKAGAVGREWVITFEGVDYRESDITVGEFERIEELAGVGWTDLAPTQSAREWRSTVQALLESREELKPVEARERVSAMKGVDAIGDARMELVDPVPFDSSEQPTT